MFAQFENQMKRGGGGGVLPWSESPASSSASASVPTASASVPVPMRAPSATSSSLSELARRAPASASVSVHIPVAADQSFEAMCPAGYSSSLLGFFYCCWHECLFEDHIHRSVSLSSILPRPLLSYDDKSKQFFEMIIKNSATLGVLALSDIERQALTDLIDQYVLFFSQWKFAYFLHSLQVNPKDSLAPPSEAVFPVFGTLPHWMFSSFLSS